MSGVSSSVTKCASCGAPIRWVKTERGRNMPVDVPPSTDGNISLVEGSIWDTAYILRRDALMEAQLDGHDLYTSHFATCPQGPAWRKKG